MSSNRQTWPGSEDTRPANAQHAGLMPRWAVASGTIASFATQRVAGHSDIYVPLVSASLAGALGSADYAILKNLAGARAFHNAAQSIASGGAGAQLAFNSERFDTNAFHDTVTNNGRLTVPTGLGGMYLISLAAQWNAAAGGARRIFGIRLNGTTQIAQWEAPPAGAGGFPAATLTTVYRLTATEYVDAFAFQDSGAGLNVLSNGNSTPEFMLVRLAD